MQDENARPSIEEAEGASEDPQPRGRDAKLFGAKHRFEVILDAVIDALNKSSVAVPEEPSIQEALHLVQRLKDDISPFLDWLWQEKKVVCSGRREVEEGWERVDEARNVVMKCLRWMEDPQDPSTWLANMRTKEEFAARLEERVQDLRAQLDKSSEEVNGLIQENELLNADLNDEIRGLRQDNRRTKESLETLQMEKQKENLDHAETLTQLDRERAELSRSNAELVSKSQDADIRIGSLLADGCYKSQTITRVENERDKSLQASADLKAQVEALRKETLDKSEMITSVETKRDEMLQANDDYSREIVQLKTRIESLEQDNRAQKEHVARVKREKDEATKGRQELRKRIVGILEERDSLSKENESLRERTVRTTEERDSLSKENESLRERTVRITEERDSLSKQKEDLHGVVIHITEERDSLSKEKQAASKARDIASKANDDLMKASECILQERDKLSEERDHVLEERDKFAEERDKLSKEKNYFEKHYETAVGTIADFEKRAEAAQRVSNLHLEAAKREQDARYLELKERFEALTEDCSRDKATLARLEAECTNRRESHASLEETHRVTANDLHQAQGKMIELEAQLHGRDCKFGEEQKRNAQLRDDLQLEQTRAGEAEREAHQATNALQELKDEMEVVRKQADQATAEMKAQMAKRANDCERFQQDKNNYIRQLELQLNSHQSFASPVTTSPIRLSMGGTYSPVATSPVGGIHVQSIYNPLSSQVNSDCPQDGPYCQYQWQSTKMQATTQPTYQIDLPAPRMQTTPQPQYQGQFQIPDIQTIRHPDSQDRSQLLAIQSTPQPAYEDHFRENTAPLQSARFSTTRLMAPNDITGGPPVAQTPWPSRPVEAELDVAKDPASPALVAQTSPLGRPPKRKADFAENHSDSPPAPEMSKRLRNSPVKPTSKGQADFLLASSLPADRSLANSPLTRSPPASFHQYGCYEAEARRYERRA